MKVVVKILFSQSIIHKAKILKFIFTLFFRIIITKFYPKKEFLELWRGIFLDAENVIKYVDGNKSLRSLGKDLGGSRGLVIIDDDSCLRDCVFEPSAVCWLDWTLFLIDLL